MKIEANPNRNRDERLMRRAIALSRQGMDAGDGGPFGALIVRGDEIIAEAWNRVIARNDPTAHAEMEAIRAACAALGRVHLDDCEIVTSAQPCPMCLGGIYWARLSRISYGNSIGQAIAAGFRDVAIAEELARPPEARTIPEIQVLSDEAFAVFRDFAGKPDRVRY